MNKSLRQARTHRKDNCPNHTARKKIRVDTISSHFKGSSEKDS